MSGIRETLVANTSEVMLLADIMDVFKQHGSDRKAMFVVALTLATDMARIEEQSNHHAQPLDAEFEVVARALDNLWNALARRQHWYDVAAVMQLQIDCEHIRGTSREPPL